MHVFSPDLPQAQMDAARLGMEDSKHVALKCCAIVQYERHGSLHHEECGEDVPDRMAGLCEYVIIVFFMECVSFSCLLISNVTVNVYKLLHSQCN